MAKTYGLLFITCGVVFYYVFFIHQVFGIVNSKIEIEKNFNVVSVITNGGGLGWGL
jgi:hypothetical protein